MLEGNPLLDQSLSSVTSGLQGTFIGDFFSSVTNRGGASTGGWVDGACSGRAQFLRTVYRLNSADTHAHTDAACCACQLELQGRAAADGLLE